MPNAGASSIAQKFCSVQPIGPQPIFDFERECVVMYDDELDPRGLLRGVAHYDPDVNSVMSAQPNFILNILKNNPGAILAGGAIRSVFDNTEVSDYDFFFKSEDARLKTINYIHLHHKPILIRRSSYHEKEILTYMIYGKIVQIMQPNISPTVADLLNEFDITAAQFGLTYEATMELPGVFAKQSPHEFRLTAYGANDAKQRVIRFNKIIRPVAILNRINKYKAKGYTVPDEEWVKFFKFVKDLPEVTRDTIMATQDWKHTPATFSVVDGGPVSFSVGAAVGVGSNKDLLTP